MREGQPCHVDTAPVQRGPALTAAAHRHPLTPEPLPAPGVRFVTYNILADQYTSQEYSQKVLFGYCPNRYSHCITLFSLGCRNRHSKPTNMA